MELGVRVRVRGGAIRVCLKGCTSSRVHQVRGMLFWGGG
jgi:hypothetical protein